MGKIKGKGYYADSYGKSQRIYDNWDEARVNKGGWKKFKTLIQAEEYVSARTGAYVGSTEVLRSTGFGEDSTYSDQEGKRNDQDFNRRIAEDVPSPCSGPIPFLVSDAEMGEFVLLSPGPGSPVDPVNVREVEVANSVKEEVVKRAEKLLKELEKTHNPDSTTTVNRIYKASRICGEEIALRYLTSETQHPVISCFREITKSDISTIFTAGKLRKNFNHLESSIVCLGVIDFLATCVNNPLYNESGKMSGKNIPGFVDKIIQELKGTLRLWGLNDQKCMQERLDIIFSFLRRLTPCFAPLNYGKAYLYMIDSLETEVRFKKTVQKPESLPPAALVPAALPPEALGSTALAPDVLVPEALGSAALAPEVLGSVALAPEALSSAALAPEALSSAALDPEALGSAALASEALSSAVLAPEALSSAALAPEALGSAALDAIPSDKSVTFDVQISKNIFETEETEDEEDELMDLPLPSPSKTKQLPKLVHVSTPNQIVKESKVKSLQSSENNNFVSVVFEYLKEPSAPKKSLSSDDDIEFLHCSGPTPKKLKLAETKIPPLTPIPTVNRKPLKNAFDILMNRSRQLAQKRRNDMAHMN